MRKLRGVTFIELLVVIGIIAMVIIAVGTLFIEASRVYARTSEHIEPQWSEMLALKRMESDLRQGMHIDTGHSSGLAAEVVLPLKDADGYNALVQDASGKLALQAGQVIRYFRGHRAPGYTVKNWVAIPDTLVSDNGDCIFKIDANTAMVGSGYPNATIVVSGLVANPPIPDPLNPGSTIPEPVFVFAPLNPDGTLNTSLTQLIKITMTFNVQETTPAGRVMKPHTLSTQFCLRNLH
jgi:type II secretory pathway pseudopilin PulG